MPTTSVINLKGMAAENIDSDQYVDGSIDNAHIADDAIDSEHYADGSIDNAHIADDAIDSEHYAAGSIDEAHIADNAVSLAKMAGGTDGQIITFDASGDPVAVGPGTDGQVLTSTGAGSPPAFEAAGGGGTRQVVQVNGAGYSATTSASYANMPGASVAITTTGGDVLVQFHTGAHLTNTGRYGYIAIRKDAGTDDRPILFIKSTGTAGANNSINGMTQFLYTSLGAGSYTFYGRWRLDYASGYLNNSGSPVMMTAMELA